MDVPPRQTVILMESLEQTQPRGASPATRDPALTLPFLPPPLSSGKGDTEAPPLTPCPFPTGRGEWGALIRQRNRESDLRGHVSCQSTPCRDGAGEDRRWWPVAAVHGLGWTFCRFTSSSRDALSASSPARPDAAG